MTLQLSNKARMLLASFLFSNDLNVISKFCFCTNKLKIVK